VEPNLTRFPAFARVGKERSYVTRYFPAKDASLRVGIPFLNVRQRLLESHVKTGVYMAMLKQARINPDRRCVLSSRWEAKR
jgi:hypothetical protein